MSDTNFDGEIPTPEEEAAHNKRRVDDMNAILAALDRNRSYGLSVEILYTAFEHMRCYPTSTIEDCINDGFSEWVK